MRELENISIDSLVLHIVDPRGMGFVPSQTELPLPGNDNLQGYFKDHISRSIAHGSATAAQFRNIDAEAPSGLCAGLLDGTIDFIQGSRHIAEHLYTILAADGRTRGGDLAICFYSAENHPSSRFLALLKIDPSQVFQHDVQTDAQGKQFVNFILEPMAFTSEKLQKCAFIRPLAPRHEDYDMILLDRQVRDPQRRDVAKYFAETFLDARNAYDDRERTDNLYKTLVRTANTVRPQLTPVQQAALDEQVHNAVRSARFDAEEWIGRLTAPDDVIRAIEETLYEQVPDREFAIDRTYSERLVRKRQFRGDHGLKVQASTRHFDDMISWQRVEEPGRRPYYQVTIETETWDETP